MTVCKVPGAGVDAAVGAGVTPGVGAGVVTGAVENVKLSKLVFQPLEEVTVTGPPQFAVQPVEIVTSCAAGTDWVLVVLPLQDRVTVDAPAPPLYAWSWVSLRLFKMVNVDEVTVALANEIDLVVNCPKGFETIQFAPQLNTPAGFWPVNAPAGRLLKSINPVGAGVPAGAGVLIGPGGGGGGIGPGGGGGAVGQVLLGWPRQKVGAAEGGSRFPLASFGLMAILSQCIRAGPPNLYINSPK